MQTIVEKGLAMAGLTGLALLGLTALPGAEAPPRFSDGGAPSVLASVSSTSHEPFPTNSKDGLSLYFRSNRPASQEVDPVYGYPPETLSVDIWVAVRDSFADSWYPPDYLSPVVNSRDWDFHPTQSPDGTALIFASEQGGSWRRDERGAEQEPYVDERPLIRPLVCTKKEL
jgi:hypothetical protein